MKIEQFRQRAGVTEKYVPGAGATPSRWDCRVGYAALVAPAPGIPDIQKYLSRTSNRSAPDTNEIGS